MSPPDPLGIVPAEAIDEARDALAAFLEPWLTAEVHGTTLESQLRTAALVALLDAAPHLAATAREWARHRA